MSNSIKKSIGRGPGYSEAREVANLISREIKSNTQPWNTGNVLTFTVGGQEVSFEEKEYWFTLPADDDPSGGYLAEITVPLPSGYVIRDVTDLWVYNDTIGLFPMTSADGAKTFNVLVNKTNKKITVSAEDDFGTARGRIKYTQELPNS
jgi:hypothetical protein